MRLPSLIRRFISDQRGNTPANVAWILLILGFSGITIDTVRAFQMKTMMQATADAGALGAALELAKTPENAPAMATAMVDLNMPSETYGNLLTEEEVLVGQWNSSIGQLNVGAEPPNAAWVTLRRATDRGNSFGTSLLTLVGLNSWDISVQAIAMSTTRDCESADGIIANGIVDFNSVNRFGDNFCVYGHDGIHVNNGNDFTGLPLGGDGTGALVGMGEDAYQNYGCDGVEHQGGGNDPCDWGESNPGMREAHFHSDDVKPTRALGTFLDDMNNYKLIFDSNGVGVDADEFYKPCEWQSNGNGKGKGKGGVACVFDGDLFTRLATPQDDYRTVYLKCANEDDTLSLASGDYQNMSIITNCMVHIKSNGSSSTSDHSTWKNVTIITVADGKFPGQTWPPGKNSNFHVSGGNQFGMGCGLENSVNFVTSQSIDFSGNNRYRGVEITAAYNLIMAGNQNSYVDDIGSFSAHVLGDVYFTSSSDFVHCPIGPETVPVRIRSALVH